MKAGDVELAEILMVGGTASAKQVEECRACLLMI